jgi:DNA-binding response OmpR family regulator
VTAAPLKVLVIDDEPPIRKLLKMGLTTQGYQVLEATNGKTALEELAKRPDLVILDLGLPDVAGHDLLRTIRARNESVPIMVLSSRGDEAGKVQALDLGADDYVTKPFGMDELLARMRAALRHQLQSHGERPIFRVANCGTISPTHSTCASMCGSCARRSKPTPNSRSTSSLKPASATACARRIDNPHEDFRLSRARQRANRRPRAGQNEAAA